MIDTLAMVFIGINATLYVSFGCMICFTAVNEEWECVRWVRQRMNLQSSTAAQYASVPEEFPAGFVENTVELGNVEIV